MRRILAAALLAFASAVSAASPHEPAAAESAIRVFDADSLPAIRAAHAGKPWVLMVWSLDCAYCHESFAALAEAQRAHGVEVVALAMDRADDAQARAAIAAHVGGSGLRAEVWAFGAQSPERLRHAIDPSWRGEMPRTYWYTAKGRGAAFSGRITARVAARFL